MQPIEIESLATMEQFAAAQPGDGHGYALMGVPSVFRKQSTLGVQFRSLAYRASIAANDGVQRLVLNYEPPPDEEPLPEPCGISGSAVFVCDALGNDRELWTPGPAVAVQHSWNPGTKQLFCSPIAPIREFLLQR